jgi:hypothetical protein
MQSVRMIEEQVLSAAQRLKHEVFRVRLSVFFLAPVIFASRVPIHLATTFLPFVSSLVERAGCGANFERNAVGAGPTGAPCRAGR